MATLFPESVTRLQATSLVSDAELSNLNRTEVIRIAAKNMAEMALRKIIHDCIKTKDYMGHTGQTIYLDVCVVSPEELLQMLANAREEGREDAMRWEKLF